MSFDDIDLRILEILQQDGRASFTDMASRLSLSVGTIRNRYNKLVNDKIINIIGWVDPLTAGLNVYARVNIQIEESDQIESIAVEIAKIEQVSFIARTSGMFEIEVNIMCTNNTELLKILDTKITSIKGVKKINTTIYLKVHKWASHNVDMTSRKRSKKS